MRNSEKALWTAIRDLGVLGTVTRIENRAVSGMPDLFYVNNIGHGFLELKRRGFDGNSMLRPAQSRWVVRQEEAGEGQVPVHVLWAHPELDQYALLRGYDAAHMPARELLWDNAIAVGEALPAILATLIHDAGRILRYRFTVPVQ